VHIFIDESGTFTISPCRHAISVVGGLIIPDQQLVKLEKKYAALRPQLVTSGGEVKGRLLSERHVASVVAMLRRYEILFEVTAIDMGIHEASAVSAHKRGQEEAITKRLTAGHHPGMRAGVIRLRERLERMSPQLYVQSVVTFDLIPRIIDHGTLYYSQRRPQELAAFHWVADAKGKGRTTDWEDWWSFVVMPILQSKSLREPMAVFTEGDYSHFRRFLGEIPPYLKPHIRDPRGSGDAIDIRKLMTESFRFSWEAEPGLELVDILVNATRRALMGNLKLEGWQGIPELMIHRRHHYIHFVSLLRSDPQGRNWPYMPVLEHFGRCGKNILAPRFARR